MNHSGNIATEDTAPPSSGFSFDSILEETCERLLDRQVKYAIQRIHEMEKRLSNLERELDEFLQQNLPHNYSA
jgi:hypothetical protein